MFGLVLHSTHKDEPENTSFPIVPTGNDLMVHEGSFNLFRVSLFSFVVSDQNKGRIEACNELTQKEIDQILSKIEQHKIVN